MSAPPKPPEKPVRTLSDGVANPKQGAAYRPARRGQNPSVDPAKESDA